MFGNSAPMNFVPFDDVMNWKFGLLKTVNQQKLNLHKNCMIEFHSSINDFLLSLLQGLTKANIFIFDAF